MGAGEIDDTDGLEAAAAQALGGSSDDEGSSDGLERCPHCHRPMDDIETMEEGALLDMGKKELLKDFVRGFKAGIITHQEKAILMSMLRLNNAKVAPPPPSEEPDEHVPEPGHRTVLPEGPDDTGYDETTGG